MLFPLRAGLTLALSFLLTACNQVFVTQSIDREGNTTDGPSCTSSMGAYLLPKGEVKVRITKTVEPATQAVAYKLEGNDPTVTIKGDADHLYCLDYRPNVFALDNVGSIPSEYGLLKKVFSRNEDQSKEIAIDVAKAAAELAASRRNRNLGAPSNNPLLVRSFDFDPFDIDMMRSINASLEATGFCFYLDPTDDEFVPLEMADLCGQGSYSIKSDPRPVFVETTSSTNHRALAALPLNEVGVLYRPFLQHSLIIMRQFDPGSSDPWVVWKRVRIALPNRAPTMVMRVKRTTFNTRKTVIDFTNGALTSVEINKGSSVKGASELLIGVVGAVVGIPARAVSLGLTKATNQRRIIEAQTNLIGAQRALTIAQNTARDALSGRTLTRAEVRDRALLDCTRNHASLDQQAAFEECSEEFNSQP